MLFVVYYTADVLWDVVLSTGAMLLCIAACVFGMRRDANVSDSTNLVKKVSYPLVLLIAASLVALNFTMWNSAAR